MFIFSLVLILIFLCNVLLSLVVAFIYISFLCRFQFVNDRNILSHNYPIAWTGNQSPVESNPAWCRNISVKTIMNRDDRIAQQAWNLKKEVFPKDCSSKCTQRKFGLGSPKEFSLYLTVRPSSRYQLYNFIFQLFTQWPLEVGFCSF